LKSGTIDGFNVRCRKFGREKVVTKDIRKIRVTNRRRIAVRVMRAAAELRARTIIIFVQGDRVVELQK